MSSRQKYKALIPLTPQEQLVQDVYGRIDAAADRELDRLQREEGVVSSCQRGCCSCCGQHIQTNPAEAHALGRFIQRTFSARQVSSLRQRTQQWHIWHAGRRKGEAPSDPAAGLQLSDYEPFCPLLVDRVCSVYPVRPVICRTHFVSSDPSNCRPSQDNQPLERAPVALMSILRATQPFSEVCRADIEAAGLDFSRSILLLPHWLAIEMGWELD